MSEIFPEKITFCRIVARWHPNFVAQSGDELQWPYKKSRLRIYKGAIFCDYNLAFYKKMILLPKDMFYISSKAMLM